MHFRVDVAELPEHFAARRGVGWADDLVVLVNPNRSRYIHKAIKVGDYMKLVYENRHRELLFSRPLAHGSFVSVQGHSDNRETRVLQFVSELLPNWQLVATASPR